MFDYNLDIEALLGTHERVDCCVTFVYKKGDGEWIRHSTIVNINDPLPELHIHEVIDEGDVRKVFRYWKLESGTVTSSLTVMSDVTFVGVYDDMEMPLDST